MAAQTLEVHQIGEQFYVTVREAAGIWASRIRAYST
jgi:hypothetical protein